LTYLAHEIDILAPKMYILTLKMYILADILAPKMYILTLKMYILASQMYILAHEMDKGFFESVINQLPCGDNNRLSQFHCQNG